MTARSAGAGEGLKLGLYRCPSCGAELEIFSDETSVRCYECNAKVVRERLSPCIDWCAAARQCRSGGGRKEGRRNLR